MATEMTTTQHYGQWQVYPGNDLSSLALPDYFSIYLSYTLDTTTHPGLGLRISGNFPFARYMSVNIYGARTGTSLGALTDYQIMTRHPNINPFVAGNTESELNREYVFNVERQSDPASEQTGPARQNLLTYDPEDLLNPAIPEQKLALLTVIIRYYVPKLSEDGHYGGVDAPKVQVYKLPDGIPEDAPPGYPTQMDVNKSTFQTRLAPIFTTAGPDNRLRFYHAAGSGQFNNADNIYLICAALNVDGINNCVILKLKPPSFPLTHDEFDKTQVRYWSFNQGNPDTSTPLGIKDQDLKLATDGFVYLVMGPNSLSGKAAQNGYNYMPWKADKQQAVILYRNMLTIPQYRGSIAKVPELPPAADPPPPPPWPDSVLAADEAYISLCEYAPVGKIVTTREFNENFGGMPSPGFA